MREQSAIQDQRDGRRVIGIDPKCQLLVAVPGAVVGGTHRAEAVEIQAEIASAVRGPAPEVDVAVVDVVRQQHRPARMILVQGYAGARVYGRCEPDSGKDRADHEHEQADGDSLRSPARTIGARRRRRVRPSMRRSRWRSHQAPPPGRSDRLVRSFEWWYSGRSWPATSDAPAW